MQAALIAKLYKYIIDNNLDLLIMLQEEIKVSCYLEEKVATADELINRLQSENKPAYIIEEECLEFLTEDLRPSRFSHILSVLEEEFENDYQRFRESGVLTYEVLNLIETCKPVFEVSGFTSDNEDDRHLHFAIIGAIKEYLENKQ